MPSRAYSLWNHTATALADMPPASPRSENTTGQSGRARSPLDAWRASRASPSAGAERGQACIVVLLNSYCVEI